IDTDLLPVDEAARVVKDGSEPNPDAVVQPFLRDLDGSAVDPDARSHAQVRELGLPGTWHNDLTNLGGARKAVVRHMQKFPGAVQADAVVLHDISLNQRLPKDVQNGEKMAD